MTMQREAHKFAFNYDHIMTSGSASNLLFIYPYTVANINQDYISSNNSLSLLLFRILRRSIVLSLSFFFSRNVIIIL